jgi:hypothetical protein
MQETVILTNQTGVVSVFADFYNTTNDAIAKAKLEDLVKRGPCK